MAVSLSPLSLAPAPCRSFPERTTLTRGDRAVLRAVAEAMFSEDGEVESARLDAHLDEVDAFISSASKPLRAGLRIALFVVRIAPLLFFFRFRMIESLAVRDRTRVLARLERSRVATLSLAFIGWRTVMTLVFYEHPIELESLGYAGDARQVYKRRLPTLVPRVRLAPAPAPLPSSSAPPAPAATPALAATPVPVESGVRLREGVSDAELASGGDSGEHEVA